MKTVKLATLSGGQTVFDVNQVADFASGFRGRVVLAGDHGRFQGESGPFSGRSREEAAISALSRHLSSNARPSAQRCFRD